MVLRIINEINMKKIFIETDNIQKFEDAITELCAITHVKSIMVLACDNNNWQPKDIDPILRNCKKFIFGGIFSQVINNGKIYKTGTILIGFPVESKIHVLNNLSDSNKNYMDELEILTEEWADETADRSMIVFVDGASRRIESFVKSLFYCFGLEQNFIGGGAGSLSFQQKPCIITPNGLIQDSAIMINLPVSSGVGVAHGWKKISKSIKVTEIHQNTIKTLDWRPAFEVYQELIIEHSGLKINAENFFNIAQSYPFGIKKLEEEVVVREVVRTEDNNSIVCVGEITKGSFIYLLYGKKDSIISAAMDARKSANKYLPDEKGTTVFPLLLDCISRYLFLGEKIDEEIQAISQNDDIVGIFTFGEIANKGNDFLEFHNKTSVIGLLNIPE